MAAQCKCCEDEVEAVSSLGFCPICEEEIIDDYRVGDLVFSIHADNPDITDEDILKAYSDGKLVEADEEIDEELGLNDEFDDEDDYHDDNPEEDEDWYFDDEDEYEDDDVEFDDELDDRELDWSW